MLYTSKYFIVFYILYACSFLSTNKYIIIIIIRRSHAAYKLYMLPTRRVCNQEIMWSDCS